MSLFTDPPRTTKATFKRGDVHLGVWSIQRLLNIVYSAELTEDGWFGSGTEFRVKQYQADTGAVSDGIVGPQTQERMVRSCIVRAPHGKELPKGLLEGIVAGESGGYIMAVNSSVPGGLDLGFTQRRVYGPPFDSAAVASAADPVASVAASVDALYQRYLQYSAKPAHAKGREYTWRLAALAHNWPWAASELANNHTLSTSKIATWAPQSLKFPDGAPVKTYADWAAFYAMGSHAHAYAGYVTGRAFGIPFW
jgi:peptidoglycan hydrolase-like protein with peptidoglycan-binding domain